MMVPFGFSVGDFIAGINLLIDSVNSLSETRGAKADHQELQRELISLKSALDGIHALSLDEAQAPQISAVNTAVDRCRLCVDGFVERNSKFEGLDSAPAKQWSFAAFRIRALKVQWAILKKTDVAKFRAEIQQHSDYIHMLLVTLQIKQVDDEKKLSALNEQRDSKHIALTKSIGTNISDLSLGQRRLETALSDQHGIVTDIHRDTQGISEQQASLAQSIKAQHEDIKSDVQNLDTQLSALKALEYSLMRGATSFQQDMLDILVQGVTQNHTIIQSQQKILRQVQALDTMFRVSQDVPPQVLLSTPVVLLDACGRVAPFHLEFIDSAEAFVAVLRIRFKDTGLRKIETGEYVLEDTRRKQNLKLTQPWTKIVKPGQHIGMSMVFRLQEPLTTKCPSCGKENEGSYTEDIQCGDLTCRMTYRRIVELGSPGNDTLDFLDDGDAEPPSHLLRGSQRRQVSSQDDCSEDEIGNYTRVQILSPPTDLGARRLVAKVVGYRSLLSLAKVYNAFCKPVLENGPWRPLPVRSLIRSSRHVGSEATPTYLHYFPEK